MPRVNNLTPQGKIQDSIHRLSRQLKHDLSDAHISYTKIAEYADISPQAVSQQFKNEHLTIEVLTTAKMLLEGELK